MRWYILEWNLRVANVKKKVRPTSTSTTKMKTTNILKFIADQRSNYNNTHSKRKYNT